MVRQDVIEDMLEHALREAGVAVHWRHDISALQPAADHVTATVDRLEKESRGYVVAHTEWVVGRRWDLQTPFVLGADGYNSRVRRTLNIEYPEVAPAQYYAVFEFETDAKLGDEVTLGMRPHHLTIGGARDMTGRVALVERLGNETLAAIVLGSGQQIIAALPGDIDVAAGQELHLATQLDRASLFLADGVAA